MFGAIITGASKGLGLEVAKQLVKKGVHVWNISRSNTTTINSELFKTVCTDLSNVEQTVSSIQTIWSEISALNIQSLYVLNNAATIEPIHTAGHLNVANVAIAVQLNLVAPIVIVNELMKLANKTPTVEMTILNVSSGAAKRAIQGWSTYCATKAGLELFVETVALELETAKSNHKMAIFNPGVMDTNMQETIRSSDEGAFHDVENFRAYKEQGQLKHPYVVASIVTKLFTESIVKNDGSYNVKDFL